MKTILTNSITTSAKQPFLGPSLAFLQTATKEVVSELLKGIIKGYTTNDVIIIEGCIVSGSGPYAVTAGSLYYNGEIYLVDANASITVPGGQTLVWTLDTSTYDGTIDPVTFSDLTTHSVHQIRKAVLGAGTSGSGIADYNASTVHYLTPLVNSGSSLFSGSTVIAGPGAVTIDSNIIGQKYTTGMITVSGTITFTPSANITVGSSVIIYLTPTTKYLPIDSSGYYAICIGGVSGNSLSIGTCSWTISSGNKLSIAITNNTATWSSGSSVIIGFSITYPGLNQF